MSRTRLFLVALVATLAPTVAGAKNADLCLTAAAAAEKRHGLPAGLLSAITLVETGRFVGGARRAWPWSVNIAGVGRHFDTRKAAQKHVARAQARGATSIDVGCFQINLRWHARAFKSATDYFAPSVGADYAARFLRALKEREGDWKAAVGAYHSSTPGRGSRYRAKVYAALGEAVAAAKDVDPVIPPAPLLRSAPALRTANAAPSARGGVTLAVFGDRLPFIDGSGAPMIDGAGAR
ncbi:MAG: lytic transglycosylase domain-containing protein [Pseudomonadota bacterium]